MKNVPAALAYYRDRLGFDITFQGPDPNDILRHRASRPRDDPVTGYADLPSTISTDTFCFSDIRSEETSSIPRALQWPFNMQVLQAGPHKFIYLELEADTIAMLAKQAGFDSKARETDRLIQLDLAAPSREGPLLLFDAADPANLGWFSRCQFYVDGRNGGVMQTPISLANKRDRGGRASLTAVRLTISKELPASYRLPGKQPLTEQVFYHLFLNFLRALVETGVAVCGVGSVQPLAGRTETVGSRN